MPLIIAVVGMPGSGKSEATSFFTEKGFSRLRFGQITIDTLKERGLEINEENERKIREELRKKHGMAAYAVLNLPKINEIKNNRIILDGLYSWEEYRVLKKEFPELKLIAVYSSPETRYRRLESRKERPLSIDDSYFRDISEIENLNKAGPIAMADYTVINETTLLDFKRNLELIFGEIENGKA